ncbi:RNA polymerase II-associated protein 3-like isoform X2 [Battus philenor]|uniref:RNA polymerase II-associated protein 3-like isoform X2 n=1 Tax=Battus philenor TaxID=42288 RepID=UPI0035D0FD15
MKKAYEIQKNARDNVKTLQSYMTDLQNWESEMKRKEAALNGDFVKDLPPVRSKVKKERPLKPKTTTQKRISSSDYTAWEKFDVEKACEDVDMADIGPVSLDSKKSQKDKQEKLREEAQYEKERGNTFVKQEKWDEAITCYNRAIELVKDDAIYYANRGLCYLKKDSLHQAENDCTAALKIDPTYVKALQRRATARERLGSLRAASHDLNEVLKLEPHNAAAKRQLEAIKTRMGTKGAKSKSSPATTPTFDAKTSKETAKKTPQPKIIELPEEPVKAKEQSELEKWRIGEGEDINVMIPVKKPPHLRSKRALKSIPIQEIPLGKTSPEKPTRMKIIEIEDNMAQGDTGNNDSNILDSKEEAADKSDKVGEGDSKTIPESLKLITDEVTTEKQIYARDVVPPVNSVQFMAEWKYLKGHDAARGNYLSIIEPTKIPSIFENALESDVLSEILQVLWKDKEKFREKSITAYLKGLCRVKRFSALAMFLSSSDKKVLNELLEHCKSSENCTEDDLVDLKNKYEL